MTVPLEAFVMCVVKIALELVFAGISPAHQ
ncbi:DUF1196 domain-containing protein [Vibrio cholerae]|nr:DUF1196 domain-containing protein [Vibrio cholerae]